MAPLLPAAAIVPIIPSRGSADREANTATTHTSTTTTPITATPTDNDAVVDALFFLRGAGGHSSGCSSASSMGIGSASVISAAIREQQQKQEQEQKQQSRKATNSNSSNSNVSSSSSGNKRPREEVEEEEEDGEIIAEIRDGQVLTNSSGKKWIESNMDIHNTGSYGGTVSGGGNGGGFIGPTEEKKDSDLDNYSSYRPKRHQWTTSRETKATADDEEKEEEDVSYLFDDIDPLVIVGNHDVEDDPVLLGGVRGRQWVEEGGGDNNGSSSNNSPHPTSAAAVPEKRDLSAMPPLGSSRYGDDDNGGANDANSNNIDGGDNVISTTTTLSMSGRIHPSKEPRYENGGRGTTINPFGNINIKTKQDETEGKDKDKDSKNDNDYYGNYGKDKYDEEYQQLASTPDGWKNVWGKPTNNKTTSNKVDDPPPSVTRNLESMFVSAGTLQPLALPTTTTSSSSSSSSRYFDQQARPTTRGGRGGGGIGEGRFSIINTSKNNKTNRRGSKRSKSKQSKRRGGGRYDQYRQDCYQTIRANVHDPTRYENESPVDMPSILGYLMEHKSLCRAGRSAQGITQPPNAKFREYFSCADLAHAATISRDFKFWVDCETRNKALAFKASTSLAWKVGAWGEDGVSADKKLGTGAEEGGYHEALEYIDDPRWNKNDLPTPMDLLDRVAGWGGGGWLQFLHSRDVLPMRQPSFTSSRSKTILDDSTGQLPKCALVFDLRCNDEWRWSGIRPLSQAIIDQNTNPDTGWTTIYPFSAVTKGDVTDAEHYMEPKTKRASKYLLSASVMDQRMWTLSVSIVSEKCAETLIHEISFVPHDVADYLDYNEWHHPCDGEDDWMVGDPIDDYDFVKCFHDRRYRPRVCAPFVEGPVLVGWDNSERRTKEFPSVHFSNCFWIDSREHRVEGKPMFHMMTELVCEKKLFTQMLLNGN